MSVTSEWYPCIRGISSLPVSFLSFQSSRRRIPPKEALNNDRYSSSTMWCSVSGVQGWEPVFYLYAIDWSNSRSFPSSRQRMHSSTHKPAQWSWTRCGQTRRGGSPRFRRNSAVEIIFTQPSGTLRILWRHHSGRTIQPRCIEMDADWEAYDE